MSVKLLATADLHLGRETAGLSESNGESFPSALVLQSIIDYAINNQVDAILMTGDIIDHENRFFEAIGILERGLNRLADAGIHVLLTAGNHDYDVLPSVMKSINRDNIHLLGNGGTWKQLPLQLNNIDFVFHGWSFPKRHFSTDPTSDFPSIKGYENAIQIGLIHGDYNVPNSPYAPINQGSLMIPGMDIWVMGHIHKPEIFRETAPLIFYPGSPQALSPKERGKHGPWMISIDTTGTISTEHIPLSSVRFDQTEVDISTVQDLEQIRNHVISETEDIAKRYASENFAPEILVFDVVLTGTFPDLRALDEELRTWAINDYERGVNGIQIRFRKISQNCSVRISDLEKIAEEPSPAGILAGAILDLQNGNSSVFLKGMKTELLEQLSKLRSNNSFKLINDDEKTALPKWDDTIINELLMKECKRMLSELMTQKMEAE